MHHPTMNCEECERLWREYAKATRAHFSLDSKLRLEALTDGHENIAALTLSLEEAERARAAAREAIREHDAMRAEDRK